MIRQMKKEDTQRIMTIWLQSTIIAHDFIEKSYWEKAYDVVKKEYLPQSVTFVYEKDGDLLGFIGIITDDTIGALFVDPAHLKHGIGKSLLDEAKKHYNLLSVSVYQKNKNAVGFYKHCGFEFSYTQIDTNTNEKEDVLIYKKETI
jgi:putative acetyltransferase